MDAVEEIVRLAWSASRREDINSAAVLPFAADALNVISAHPDMQTEFENTFEVVIAKGCDPEFFEVLCHALRWPSLKLRFERLYQSAVTRNDWRAAPVYEHILEALDPDWGDANEDFYGDFFRRKPAT